MGGKNEQVVETPIAPGCRIVDKIRIHESGGHIHFHDDVKGAKVAVPVSEFWTMWNLFKSGRLNSPLVFIDSVNGGELKIGCSGTALVFPLVDPIEVEITLRKVTFGPGFTVLDSFAK